MKIIFIPFLFLIIHCTAQTSISNHYYFPISNFFNEKSYCFINQNDTTDIPVWRMKTIILKKDTLFQTSIFDNKNRIIEIMTEKVVKGISRIQHYTLFSYDKQGSKHSSDCQILDSVVFNEQQKINESIQWKVHFKDFSSSNTCELTKIRVLKNTEENQNTYSDLMRFVVLETKYGYEYYMTAVYQKNKGLVAYKVNLPGGVTKNYILKEIK